MRSIACLPALTGAWRQVGGGLLQLPLWAFPVNWPALLHPELATPGTRVVNQFLLGRALAGELGLDPPVTALMVYNSNPVVVCPEQEKMIAGLSREDLFTVVSDHFLTDTACYADLVLPATTQLEQHDIMFSWGHLYVTLNTPAIEPVGEAISNTELFRRLAARMGFTEECFTRTDEQMMAEAFDWSAPAMAGITLESLRLSGWARLNLPSADEYAPHAEGGFPTPSGKVEFRSSIAEQAGNFVLPLFRQGSNEHQPGGTVDPLPHYVPPRETADTGYRLNLISPKSHAYLNSSAGDQPTQRRVQGEQAVTVHPHDAAERGITDGRYVRVFNDRGQFVALARVTDEIAPGVVMAPMGAWRKNAKGHSTVNAVTPFVFADLGNAPTFSDTKVEIEPAEPKTLARCTDRMDRGCGPVRGLRDRRDRYRGRHLRCGPAAAIPGQRARHAQSADQVTGATLPSPAPRLSRVPRTGRSGGDLRPVNVVDPGYVVDPVHGRPLNQPHNPDRPPYSARQPDIRDKLP